MEDNQQVTRKGLLHKTKYLQLLHRSPYLQAAVQQRHEASAMGLKEIQFPYSSVCF